jgi:hypothetical protein
VFGAEYFEMPMNIDRNRNHCCSEKNLCAFAPLRETRSLGLGSRKGAKAQSSQSAFRLLRQHWKIIFAAAAGEPSDYYLDLFLKDHKLTAKFNRRKRGKVSISAPQMRLRR